MRQEGITSFDVDIDRGYLYGVTVPGVYFLVYDLNTERVYNAGAVPHNHPSRYIASDPSTGKVYHKGEATPGGIQTLTVWDPEQFRLYDVEIAVDGDFEYRHPYAITNGPAGSHTLYSAINGKVFVIDLDESKDGKVHVKPLCSVGVDGEVKEGNPYTFALGPDNRVYWGCNYGDHGDLPIAFFAWDPATKKKSYLGTCALDGEWIHGGMTQGISFDSEGNMAIHVLYCGLSEHHRTVWSVSDDFDYKDIVDQPYYLGYPGHFKDTFYSVLYVKNATSIK